MVQYGAKGKADRGLDHAQILAFYYGGLTPVKTTEPGSIRISLAIGLDDITVERQGNVKIEGIKAPDGPVRLTGDPTVGVTAGQPIDPTLKIDGVTLVPAPVIPTPNQATPGVPESPGVPLPAAAGPSKLTFTLSAPARVHAVLKGPDGADHPLAEEPKDRGPQELVIETASLSLPPGPYQATLEAEDGVDKIASPPTQIQIAAPAPAPTPSPTQAPKPSPPSPKQTQEPAQKTKLLWYAASALTATTAIGLLVFLLRRKRTRGSPN